jgi:hypothetical protein
MVTFLLALTLFGIVMFFGGFLLAEHLQDCRETRAWNARHVPDSDSYGHICRRDMVGDP